MLQLIATEILMISLGVMLYLVVRTMPRVEENHAEKPRGMIERWLRSEMPERLDATINGFLFKFLRRAKVMLLKIDNAIATRLTKLKADDATNNKPKIDFFVLSGNGKEASGEKGKKAEN